MILLVILSSGDVDRISRTSEGTLDEVPFAVLLYALARAERTVTLEIFRKPLTKEILIEGGIPVQCRSNLAHETLSRFMLSIGRLDEGTANECLAESCTKNVRFGDVLIERGLISAEELLKVLQQNLARKLLDGFSWHEGSYRLSGIPPKVDSTLKVNIPRLIVLGVTRFATQQQVDGSIGPLIGKALGLHPSPFFSLDDIRVNPRQRLLTEVLATNPMRIDELASAIDIPYEELTRTLYALTLIGVIVPADQLPEQKPPAPVAAPTRRVTAAPPESAEEEGADSDQQRDRLMEMVLNFRRRDAFDLLGVDPAGSIPEVNERFLHFAEKFGPWKYGGDLVADARRVFLAGARAYGELADPDRRQALLDRRQARDEPQPTPTAGETFRIKTDLLDPGAQYRKGRALMARGRYKDAITQLEYAADLDPQNGDYRAELAYCRFLQNPGFGGQSALDDLQETLRIDPENGLAVFYRGEVLRHRGELDEAEHAYRLAIRLMAPDRRPIDALRELRRGE